MNDHIFSNRKLILLLIPIIAEQFLNSLMGMADSMMVSNVGAAALSGVSLVDSINNLVVQTFAALATGGVIICATYIGQKDHKRANDAAAQLILVAAFISFALMLICMIFRDQLLSVIFGKIDADVMRASSIYFLMTILSYPGIALAAAGGAIFRAEGNTRLPMNVAIVSNILNVAGNALFIFGFNMGVFGAALATLLSRIFSTAVLLVLLHRPGQIIRIGSLHRMKPDFSKIKRILAMGIPNGIENSMFQFGKLVIQSTVSTMGTIAITAQAMTNIMENVNGVAACGVGIGLMTVVGQSLGAGRKDEAKYYVKKLAAWAEIAIVASCLFVFVLRGPITSLGGMNYESAKLCMYMCGLITIVKPLFWVPSFLPAYGMRAAGDVRFSMILSVISMWAVRVGVTLFLVHVVGFVSPIAVWCGMFSDWFVRGVCFTIRFMSGKWLEHKVA